jgi:hypothetical protein
VPRTTSAYAEVRRGAMAPYEKQYVKMGLP